MCAGLEDQTSFDTILILGDNKRLSVYSLTKSRQVFAPSEGGLGDLIRGALRNSILRRCHLIWLTREHDPKLLALRIVFATTQLDSKINA